MLVFVAYSAINKLVAFSLAEIYSCFLVRRLMAVPILRLEFSCIIKLDTGPTCLECQRFLGSRLCQEFTKLDRLLDLSQKAQYRDCVIID